MLLVAVPEACHPQPVPSPLTGSNDPDSNAGVEIHGESSSLNTGRHVARIVFAQASAFRRLPELTASGTDQGADQLVGRRLGQPLRGRGGLLPVSTRLDVGALDRLDELGVEPLLAHRLRELVRYFS